MPHALRDSNYYTVSFTIYRKFLLILTGRLVQQTGRQAIYCRYHAHGTDRRGEFTWLLWGKADESSAVICNRNINDWALLCVPKFILLFARFWLTHNSHFLAWSSFSQFSRPDSINMSDLQHNIRWSQPCWVPGK